MRISDIPGIESLSASEKILLVEDLWDRISIDEASMPVPRSHKEELDRRLKLYESHPGNLLTLEDLQEGIKSRR
jgi:putative addiction module component (TIGR02574 family)